MADTCNIWERNQVAHGASTPQVRMWRPKAALHCRCYQGAPMPPRQQLARERGAPASWEGRCVARWMWLDGLPGHGMLDKSRKLHQMGGVGGWGGGSGVGRGGGV